MIILDMPQGSIDWIIARLWRLTASKLDPVITSTGKLSNSIAAAKTHPSYPVKPVRMLVHYPPGGPTDAVARMVAQKLTDALGQQFIIDNRSGASGIVGVELVARAVPDGYTLLFGTEIGRAHV